MYKININLDILFLEIKLNLKILTTLKINNKKKKNVVLNHNDDNRTIYYYLL